MWLDTSVLIAGVRGTDSRVVELLDVVASKLRDGKLVCVESEQSNEVEGHAGADEVKRLLRRLSYQLQLRPPLERDGFQVAAGMRAFLAGATKIEIPREAFFADDPDRRLIEVRRRGYFIAMTGDMPRELIDRAKDSKGRTVGDLEALRQKNRHERVPFAKQYERERGGFLPGQHAMQDRWLAELTRPEPDALLVAAGVPFRRYLRIWRELGGDANEAFAAFFGSEHFLRLPCNEIEYRLYADLLTADRPVLPSDAMDIQHMAAALPIATWIVTDKSLANRVRRRNLHQHWGAKVYALEDHEALVVELRAL